MVNQGFNSIIAADLHGNRKQYQALLDLAKSSEFEFLFLAGDLFPKTGGLWTPENKIRTPELQKDFITTFFYNWLEEIGKFIKVFFITGNDDFAVNTLLLKQLPKNIHFINSKLLDVTEDIKIFGYPYVSLTPFQLKDWEKIDYIGEQHKLISKSGYKVKSVIEKVNFEIDNPNESTIEKDLNSLFSDKDLDHKKLIVLFHDAPYQTNLDLTSATNPFLLNSDVHVGSKSIKKFIEEFQPLFTMHGHIHETVELSKKHFSKIGNSYSFSPGNFYDRKELAIILMNLKNPENNKRVLINNYD